jgi:hypothetical protein
VLAILGMLAPPSFAQAPPAPKVTITGLVDFATSVYKNTMPGDAASGNITDDSDTGWYSRERGVFTVTGEIGKSKGVLALEFDFLNGAGGVPTGFPVSRNLDVGTDEAGTSEVKWLYVETPITGDGSLLPFIPVPSIGRFGGQPIYGHSYKPGLLVAGDFAGANLATTWAPNLRSNLTYMQIDEAIHDGILAGNARTEADAILVSVEMDVFKGLTVKPTYAYFHHDGGSALAFANTARGGFDPSAFDNRATTRHTIGGDVRWTAGPWSLAPSFFYQWGTLEVACTVWTGCPAGTSSRDVDINSWIFDVIAGFRSGPLTIEGRFAWTPGMKATDCVQTIAGVCAGGSDVEYYQPLSGDPSYWSGWAEIETSNIDYIMTLNPNHALRLGSSPSYDKYGRIIFGFAVDYAVTPALALHLYSNWQWTDEKVDIQATHSGNAVAGGLTPVSAGDESYLGNEWAAGLTYRFAPNVAFDLIGAVLFTGDARKHGRTSASTTDTFDAENVYRGSARIRVTF